MNRRKLLRRIAKADELRVRWATREILETYEAVPWRTVHRAMTLSADVLRRFFSAVETAPATEPPQTALACHTSDDHPKAVVTTDNTPKTPPRAVYGRKRGNP